jgi:hypothetical protein
MPSAARFHKIEQHARLRLAVFLGKRHKRGRGLGWSVLAYKSADFCGVAEPGWSRDRTQGRQALAGETECRR